MSVKGKEFYLKTYPESLPEIHEDSSSEKTTPNLPNDTVERDESSTHDERLQPSVKDEKVGNFGSNETNTSTPDNLSPPPTSISLKESYDIAYAHTRKLTDANLLELVEKEMIQRSLTESGGNQVKASALLGITRATLRKRIDAYSIRY